VQKSAGPIKREQVFEQQEDIEVTLPAGYGEDDGVPTIESPIVEEAVAAQVSAVETPVVEAPAFEETVAPEAPAAEAAPVESEATEEEK
jgi:hypothetical protein